MFAVQVAPRIMQERTEAYVDALAIGLRRISVVAGGMWSLTADPKRRKIESISQVGLKIEREVLVGDEKA